jgi:hypothetical protein
MARKGFGTNSNPGMSFEDPDEKPKSFLEQIDADSAKKGNPKEPPPLFPPNPNLQTSKVPSKLSTDELYMANKQTMFRSKFKSSPFFLLEHAPPKGT